MDLTNFMVDAGVKENALGGGCFSGVNVGANTDVSVAINRGLTSHGVPVSTRGLNVAART